MGKISIIIRNRNENEHIGFAIKDRTDIKVITINDYTPGKSINLGVKHATNERILVLSAHAQITSLNIEMLNRWFREGHVAVFGNQTPIYKGKRISKRYIWSHFTNDIEENLYSKIEDRHFLHNAFCFYSKEFLIKNPMPEQYPGKEDRFWALDVVKKGYTYLYDGFYQKCNHFYTNNGATWKGIG
jgi:rhamnosyltransferase